MKKVVIEDIDSNQSISIEECDDGYTYLTGYFENLRIFVDDEEVPVLGQEKAS